MPMDRRSFLQTLGLTATATLLGTEVLARTAAADPARRLSCASHPRWPTSVHRLALRTGGCKPGTMLEQLGGGHHSVYAAYFVPLEPHRLTRIEIFVDPVDVDPVGGRDPGIRARLRGIATGAKLGEVLFQGLPWSIGYPDEPKIIDAAFFATTNAALYCPVDGPTWDDNEPLVFECRATQETLLPLALQASVFDPRLAWPSCPGSPLGISYQSFKPGEKPVFFVTRFATPEESVAFFRDTEGDDD